MLGPEGAPLGIKPLPEALQLARELELDLVEIAPMANPPVCKILDYPKYLYELKQKDKEARKKSVAISIKEMKYRPKIGGGDFDTKTRKVAEFLSEGHKVKITIMFRGREVAPGIGDENPQQGGRNYRPERKNGSGSPPRWTQHDHGVGPGKESGAPEVQSSTP